MPDGVRFRDPVTAVRAFLTQFLHGNTTCTIVPHLLGQRFSAAAYVQARVRLPLDLLERLFDRITHGLHSERQAASR